MSRTRRPKTPSRTPLAASRPRGLSTASAAMEEAARAEAADTQPRKAAAAKPKPKTRAGKKGLVLYVLPEVTLALRKLALEHGSDVQKMGCRALELLFAEYKIPLPGATKAPAAKS